MDSTINANELSVIIRDAIIGWLRKNERLTSVVQASNILTEPEFNRSEPIPSVVVGVTVLQDQDVSDFFSCQATLVAISALKAQSSTVPEILEDWSRSSAVPEGLSADFAARFPGSNLEVWNVNVTAGWGESGTKYESEPIDIRMRLHPNMLATVEKPVKVSK